MKRIFLYVLITFIILVLFTLIMFSNKEEKDADPLKEKLELLNNIDRKIDFFEYKFIDRYLSFKKNNPDLDDIDVVTRVNLNLDYPYYSNTKQSNHLNKLDILVNKYIYLPSSYVPDNLEDIEGKKLVKDAKVAFLEMQKQAKIDGYNIRIVSAYRSYSYQENLYNGYVEKDGIEKADTYSARPGYSEHQTGLVIDIDNGITNYDNFDTTEEFNWMQENSYKYGFILRYPKDKVGITGYSYESWHYRYVGKDIAKYIKDNNLSFDEYYVRFIEK